MPMGLHYSTDGGATFNTVSVDVADYTLTPSPLVIANRFISVKDSQNNTYTLCVSSDSGLQSTKAKIIKIEPNGIKKIATLNWDYSGYVAPNAAIILHRDETKCSLLNLGGDKSYWTVSLDFADGAMIAEPTVAFNSAVKFAIYKDRYIWVASTTTVKIYNYDTKAELASLAVTAGSLIACSSDNTLYGINESWFNNGISKYIFNGVDTITRTAISTGIADDQIKQLLIDRFGDLIILTNTGTASTLLKYSNIGTLIDTVNLSVGTNKGAYGLQVYSKDNGTKCWVQFGNDLGTWKTAETTAQGQVFGAVSKLSAVNTGELTYGDDNGGDNNYSVWCP